jgi:hypothetical protein
VLVAPADGGAPPREGACSVPVTANVFETLT